MTTTLQSGYRPVSPGFYASRLENYSPAVIYGNNRISDQTLRQTLGLIAESLDQRIVLTSGDRSRVLNGNNRSHHLHGRAADFYVENYSLADAYERIENLPILAKGYQLILHSEKTESPHLHLGRYHDNRQSSFIIDKGEILEKKGT